MTTSILQTSLVRLTSSRTSPGAIVQESIAPKTVSLPPTMTVIAPSRTTYTFSNGVESGPGAAAGKKLRIADPLVGGAARLEALQAQPDYAAMIGRIIGFGLCEAFDEHQNASPEAMR